MFTGTERLELLGYDVIALISAGKKEKIEVILKKLQERNLVHYLMEKQKLVFIAKECPYDLDAWEQALGEYDYMERHHDVGRKCGIINDDDGLLLVINLILNVVAEKR